MTQRREVCPECGASNRAGHTACFLCGHGLDTSWPETTTGVPKSPTSPTVAELVNPYEAPITFLEKVGTFFAALVGVVVIAVSAFIAFFMACFAYVNDKIKIDVVTGGAAAVVAAALVIFFLLSRKGG